MNDVSVAPDGNLIGGLHWFKHLVFGEFDEDRPLSVVVATMVISFTPGAVIVISARDLCAILVRLAKHPEKREEIEEWILLVACVVPLALPVLAAAVGASAAGIGAVIGGIAGSEVGAVLRNICLLLLGKSKPVLAVVVSRLRGFVKGDILRVLGDIRFANYQKAIAKVLNDAIQWLIDTLRAIREHLQQLPGVAAVSEVIGRLQALERAFYDLQRSALKWIPLALAELDARLGLLLQQTLTPSPRLADAGIAAPHALAVAGDPKRVRSKLGHVPGDAPSGKAAAAKTPPVGAQPNVHPETLQKPSSFALDIERARALRDWGGLDGVDRRRLLEGEPVIFRNISGGQEKERVLHLKGDTLFSGTVEPSGYDVNTFVARSNLLARALGADRLELFAIHSDSLTPWWTEHNLTIRGFAKGEPLTYNITDDFQRVTWRRSIPSLAAKAYEPSTDGRVLYYYHITDRSALPGIRKLGLAPGQVLGTGSGIKEDVVLFGSRGTRDHILAEGFNTMDFVHVKDPVVIKIPYEVLEHGFQFARIDRGLMSGPFVPPEVILEHNAKLFK